MKLTGQNFIGATKSGDGSTTFQAVDPESEEQLSPEFHEATGQEVNEAIERAEAAYTEYSKKSGAEKAAFLEAAADEIEALGDELIERCSRETALTEGRLTGERGRTVNQLRLFAEVVRDGSWVDARIDTGEDKPDVRSMRTALGPVGVFGASNFPLAFSVAGGDTASALAAGCPIVVKAHPAHPGTCEMVATAIQNAVEKTGMPEGTFSMVHGFSHEVGQAIAKNPLIKAIGFTGSYKGGKALFDTAAQRPEPIPVYAEMGSTNPIFVLPGAMKEKRDELAEGLFNSVTLGVGQFCTNPGLVVHESSEEGNQLHEAVSSLMKQHQPGTMLTSGIHQAYQKGIEELKKSSGVAVVAEGEKQGGNKGQSYMLRVDANQFVKNKNLEEEVFGPSTLAITANHKDELMQVAEQMSGHLTATLYGTEEDLENYADLVDLLRRKVGRLIFNGFPTGVEVNHAMVHGGPFPATTDSRMTSVGTRAINRFARPVCYQDFPESMLPDELKSDNPLGIWRLVNGERTK